MILKAGDIRQDGDQQRTKELGPVDNCYRDCSYTGWREKPQAMQGPGKWEEVCLVGHRILAADLMHMEFRRAS